jgi:hypothetical protein
MLSWPAERQNRPPSREGNADARMANGHRGADSVARSVDDGQRLRCGSRDVDRRSIRADGNSVRRPRDVDGAPVAQRSSASRRRRRRWSATPRHAQRSARAWPERTPCAGAHLQADSDPVSRAVIATQREGERFGYSVERESGQGAGGHGLRRRARLVQGEAALIIGQEDDSDRADMRSSARSRDRPGPGSVRDVSEGRGSGQVELGQVEHDQHARRRKGPGERGDPHGMRIVDPTVSSHLCESRLQAAQPAVSSSIRFRAGSPHASLNPRPEAGSGRRPTQGGTTA